MLHILICLKMSALVKTTAYLGEFSPEDWSHLSHRSPPPTISIPCTFLTALLLQPSLSHAPFTQLPALCPPLSHQSITILGCLSFFVPVSTPTLYVHLLFSQHVRNISISSASNVPLNRPLPFSMNILVFNLYPLSIFDGITLFCCVLVCFVHFLTILCSFSVVIWTSVLQR